MSMPLEQNTHLPGTGPFGVCPRVSGAQSEDSEDSEVSRTRRMTKTVPFSPSSTHARFLSLSLSTEGERLQTPSDEEVGR